MKKLLFMILLTVILLTLAQYSYGGEDGKWTGVDESVVEKFASEHGREAREPFINTEQGDLLLFLFLLAGAVGGFVAGYNWKTLVGERPAKDKETRAQGLA